MIAFVTAALPAEHHAVRLIDGSGQPFACVDLETIHRVHFRTDDNGVAAVFEPGLMGMDVWFTPIAATVVAPVDFLGIAGFSVALEDGGATSVVLDRAAPEGPCDEGDRATRLLDHGVPIAGEYHAFVVTDAATGRPIPAVRLTAPDGRTWWTDNGGRIAFFDLDLQDELVRFEIWTHGYQHDPGYVDVVPGAGGTTALVLARTLPAERLVRLTGGGLWRDTLQLELTAPLAEPLLDAQVLGQDSAHAVPWRGGLFWLWGDTNKPSYPLGSFRAPAATSAVDATPEDGVDFDYFLDPTGFARGVAPPYPDGPVWLFGLVALDDDELWTTFMNVRSDFSIIHDGMARWDDGLGRFSVSTEWAADQPIKPGGPAIQVNGPDGDWVMYRNLTRIAADPDALADPAAYQAWTPLIPNGTGYAVARTVSGAPDWQWRSDAPPPDADDLPPGESPWSSTFDPETEESPVLHNGAITWNPWRSRWIHLFTESFGSTSLIGEIWYSEGDTPVGPWSWATKVVTHDGYSFYNVHQHPWFSSADGRRIVFEGTYTGWLGTQPFTPRHDYNQFLCGLDLDQVALPVPFYAAADGPVARHNADQDATVLFGAMERDGDGLVPVAFSGPACDPERTLAVDAPGEVAFWALPAGTTGPGLTGIGEDLSLVEADDPASLATVWAPRWSATVPLSLYPLPDRADAGPDQCGAQSPVRLEGTGSRAGVPIERFTWSWAGGSAEGPTVDLALPDGVHVITLTVDAGGLALTDVVVVQVETPTPAPAPDGDGGACGCAHRRAGTGLALLVLAAMGRRRSAAC